MTIKEIRVLAPGTEVIWRGGYATFKSVHTEWISPGRYTTRALIHVEGGGEVSVRAASLQRVTYPDIGPQKPRPVGGYDSVLGGRRNGL